MINALLVIHIILAICMIGLVLIQKSEGGALGMGGGSGGGMGGFMSARGTANLLTRTTAVLATLFFLTTLGLAVLYKGGSQKSILDGVETQKTGKVSENTKDKTPDEANTVAGTPDPAEQSKAKTEPATSKETTAPSSSPVKETKKELSKENS